MKLENNSSVPDYEFKFIHKGIKGNLVIKNDGTIAEQITEHSLIDNDKEKQRLLLVLLADIKWTINSETKVSYISPFVENCIGNDAKTVIKQVVSKYLTPPSILSCLIKLEELKEILRTFKNTEPRKLVVELFANESNNEKMEISIFTIFDSKGNVIGFTGLCNYIT